MLGARRCSRRDEILVRQRIAFEVQSLARVEHWGLILLHFFFEDEAEVGELSCERGFCIAELELNYDWLEEVANRGP